MPHADAEQHEPATDPDPEPERNPHPPPSEPAGPERGEPTGPAEAEQPATDPERVQQHLDQVQRLVDATAREVDQYLIEQRSAVDRRVRRQRVDLAQRLRRRHRRLREERAELEKGWRTLRKQARNLLEQHRRAQRDGERVERRRSALFGRRRRRLRRVRDLLAARSETVKEERQKANQMREAAGRVLAQRKSLVEVQQLLTEAEENMVERWATRRAMGWLTGLLLSALLLSAISYTVGQQLATRTWAAEAVVQVRGPSVGEDAAWARAQKRRMLSEPIVDRAAAELTGEDAIGTSRLSRLLRGGLEVSLEAPGRLRVELRGTRRQRLEPALGALIGAYADRVPKISDTEPPASAHVTRSASLSPVAVADNELFVAAVTFAGGAVVCAALVLLLRWYLVRTTQRLVTEVPAEHVMDEAAWNRYSRDLEFDPPREEDS